jgi:hypothetical protein
VCLEIFSSEQYMTHLVKAHGVETKHGLVSPCRWCNFSIGFSKSGLGISVNRHVMTNHGVTSSTNKDPLPLPVPNKPLAPIFSRCSNNKITSSSSTSTQIAAYGSLYKRNLDQISTSTNVDNKRTMKRSKLVENGKQSKLDENGKRLQLSKRTGVPLGRKTVKDSMEFIDGAFPISQQELEAKLKDNSWIDLPKVQIRLQLLTDAEVALQLKKKEEMSKMVGCKPHENPK